jgi:hypothetical protein
MNLPEDKDAAWKLLLQAQKPDPSPFFARNVVREVRSLGEQPSSTVRFGFFSVPRIVFAAAALVALILAIGALLSPGERSPSFAEAGASSKDIPEATLLDLVPEAEDLTVEEFQDELEMIDYMDGLLAVQDVEVLDDEALADLLF